MRCRLRKTVKWMLTVLAVLTLVAWVGSCWWYVESWWKWGKNDVVVYLQFGQISIEITDMDLDSGPDGLVAFYSAWDSDPAIFWWFEYQEYGGWPYGTVYIPLWLPFLILATPAGWLWWRGDRRFPESACQSCGYDISGAPHERCPECGKEI